jgi:hypothetical protein
LVEKETNTAPLDLYIDQITQEWTRNNANNLASQYTHRQIQRIWATKPPRSAGKRQRRKKTAPEPDRIPTPRESTLARAREIAREREINTDTSKRKTNAAEDWLIDHWRKRWEAASAGKNSVAWQTPWDAKGRNLYQGLRREEATLAFLLRSEIIGLQDWLHGIKVPGMESPQCLCGWQRQTVKHVIINCPEISHREEMFLQAKSRDYRTILSTNDGLKAVAQWLIHHGRIEQFKVARELAQERQQGTQLHAIPELLPSRYTLDT